MLKLRWLKGKAISPVGIRRIPIQRLRGRSARSSDDALGNLRGAKGLTYQGCQIWSTYEIYFTGTNRNFNPSSIAKWRDTKSRVMGDYQARFCERLRGETPLCLLDRFSKRVFVPEAGTKLRNVPDIGNGPPQLT